jgi:hypothetical protein
MVRASLGGPQRGEGHNRCSPLVRGIAATAEMSLWRSLTPGRLALQLLQFRVDRAETPLTGHVWPPAHHEGAAPAAGPPEATGGVL